MAAGWRNAQKSPTDTSPVLGLSTPACSTNNSVLVFGRIRFQVRVISPLRWGGKRVRHSVFFPQQRCRRILSVTFKSSHVSIRKEETMNQFYLRDWIQFSEWTMIPKLTRQFSAVVVCIAATHSPSPPNPHNLPLTEQFGEEQLLIAKTHAKRHRRQQDENKQKKRRKTKQLEPTTSTAHTTRQFCHDYFTIGWAFQVTPAIDHSWRHPNYRPNNCSTPGSR